MKLSARSSREMTISLPLVSCSFTNSSPVFSGTLFWRGVPVLEASINSPQEGPGSVAVLAYHQITLSLLLNW